MRRFGLILISFLLLAASWAQAGTYTWKDGKTLVGEPEPGQAKSEGMLFRTAAGTERIEWDKFTPDDLKLLLQEDSNKSDQAVINTMIDSDTTETPQMRSIVVTPPPTPPRPLHGSGVFGLFGSPVGFFLLLVLYGANLYAAYEIAIFRHQPVQTVCGLAAIPFFGVASPIIFISMPSKPEPVESETFQPSKAATAAVPSAVGGMAEAAEAAPVEYAPQEFETPPPPPAARFPEPVTYSKADFSFNRRFFETKCAGFFRLVPAEADKDLVLVVKSLRGDFVARRITRVTPAELYLQIFNNDATADEMVPFIEIAEVQIRHKDSL